jgi:hypothetical protein
LYAELTGDLLSYQPARDEQVELVVSTLEDDVRSEELSRTHAEVTVDADADRRV